MTSMTALSTAAPLFAQGKGVPTSPAEALLQVLPFLLIGVAAWALLIALTALIAERDPD